MRKGLIAAGVLVVVGGVAAVLYSKSNSSKTNGFKTVPVARGSVVEKALAIGAIRPKREIAVKSKISGIVKTSFREIGDKVRPGDPLFEILPDPTPMELTEARREVEIAQNVFDQARKKYDRARTLKNQGILATQDWDQAEKDIQDAQIRLSLSSERLALIEKGRVKGNLQGNRLAVESIIRAPIAGTVLELLVNEGDPVVPLTSYQAGTALTNLADMNTLVFKGTVDEIDVGKLHEGMPAHIKIGALPEAKVEGKIYKISPKSKTAEGATLFDVEVREKHEVLLIPERLVTFADGKASVELPGKGEKAPPVKKEIKTGLSDGMNIEVAEGLNEKDLVIERPPKKIE
jgi:HlyD family secretion protein